LFIGDTSTGVFEEGSVGDLEVKEGGAPEIVIIWACAKEDYGIGEG
jgi:hypothetical protein